MSDHKYCDYFDIDETYFPCIDESAINAGVDWKRTYPHETFIKLLKTTENMLGGQTKRSIWIHGAYGTGKSQCAYALKRILEVPADELKDYWSRYEPLKKEEPLLNKLLGHKEKKIVTAYRYASGGIDTPQQLCLAVQESIRAALDSNNIAYKGENTLKESVIAWLESSAQKNFVNELLKQPEWSSLFSQSSVDEIINSLRNNDDVTTLMANIFRMAGKVGITALSIDADKLRNWIKDIIVQNNIKIVLIWDEFSDFFRQNKNSLGEFQKIVSICEEAPFYFIIVTHPITSLSSDDDSWKIVQQRFDKIEIELPENIAFDLIGHAFSVKHDAKSTWQTITLNLENRIPSSSRAVKNVARITDDNVIRRILPIHPYAALVLKNIASAFQSNQRSMFDFIKSNNDEDVQAFQWFIKEYGPADNEQFLTVDMLWDFFYEKGKDYLTPDIKVILDTFPQQTNLNNEEKKVLKAVLIMQAIDQRLGGSVPILKPTDQNLSYAFEGIDHYDDAAKNIAKGLVTKGVLITTPIGDGKFAYGAAVLAGDSAKIEKTKAEIKKSSTTSKLVQEGDQLPMALGLSPALKLRYANDSGALPVVTCTDFIKTMDSLKHKAAGWHFNAVLALAKDDDEAQKFRNLIRTTVKNEDYKNIIVIDALSTPLGLELFDQYVEFSAMSDYYQGNNNQQAKDNARKAKDVLNRTWRDNIHDGQFYICSFDNPDGERVIGSSNVQTILQMLVLNRYKYIQDFGKKLTEPQLKLSNARTVSKYGINGGGEVKGLIAGCEKSVLGAVWGKSEYWKIDELQSNSIVIIKKDIDALIEKEFADNGRISIGEIYDHLEDEFGFAPCNLSAFILGFLLKEYSSDPYRCINSDGYPEAMTPDKLSEMIGNYIGKTSPKLTYIVKMTPEEKEFYEATQETWGVSAIGCTSPSQVCKLISNKMREFGYPVWCLKELDNGVYDIVKMYVDMVQSDGDATLNIARKIGQIFLQRPSAKDKLKELLTANKCKEGMEIYLNHFDGGKLVNLANEIGAQDLLLTDIKKIFSVKHSALWEDATGQSEIEKLVVEYEAIKQTNQLLNGSSCNSKEKMMNSWRDFLKFIGFSGEAYRAKNPGLDKFVSYLLKIANREDFLPEMMSGLLAEMEAHETEIREMLNNRTAIFCDLYSPYLEGFDDAEKEEIKNSIREDVFVQSTNVSNEIVKNAAETYRRNQIKTQLFNSWKELTGTKNPAEWSAIKRTPILCLVDPADYDSAKRAFATLNSNYMSDSEIKIAIDFINKLKSTEFFEDIKKQDVIDRKFKEQILGEYSAVLKNIEAVRQALERLTISPYDWYDDPCVKEKVKGLANAEYNAGGSEKAVSVIDSMSDAELKRRLKELVLKDVDLGVKIIISGEDDD